MVDSVTAPAALSRLPPHVAEAVSVYIGRFMLASLHEMDCMLLSRRETYVAHVAAAYSGQGRSEMEAYYCSLLDAAAREVLLHYAAEARMLVASDPRYHPVVSTDVASFYAYPLLPPLPLWTEARLNVLERILGSQ